LAGLLQTEAANGGTGITARRNTEMCERERGSGSQNDPVQDEEEQRGTDHGT
jgi:hypothetical protein